MRRAVVLLPFVLVLAALPRASEHARAQVCSDDYVTVESVAGTILSIDPAPDPFKSADIFIAGSGACKRLWMQVLKTDARQCRVGDHIRAKGVITSDPENLAWQINPELNPYMLLGTDFTCSR